MAGAGKLPRSRPAGVPAACIKPQEKEAADRVEHEREQYRDEECVYFERPVSILLRVRQQGRQKRKDPEHSGGRIKTPKTRAAGRSQTREEAKNAERGDSNAAKQSQEGSDHQLHGNPFEAAQTTARVATRAAVHHPFTPVSGPEC
jgi:hypothetical protein